MVESILSECTTARFRVRVPFYIWKSSFFASTDKKFKLTYDPDITRFSKSRAQVDCWMILHWPAKHSISRSPHSVSGWYAAVIIQELWYERVLFTNRTEVLFDYSIYMFPPANSPKTKDIILESKRYDFIKIVVEKHSLTCCFNRNFGTQDINRWVLFKQHLTIIDDYFWKRFTFKRVRWGLKSKKYIKPWKDH